MAVRRRIALGLVVACLLSLPVACGGSSSGGSSGGDSEVVEDCAAPFSANLGGTWLVLEALTSESGGCGSSQRTFQSVCVQSPSGESLTVVGATTFTGTARWTLTSAGGASCTGSSTFQGTK